MPIVIIKSEPKIKKIGLMKNMRAWFLTLAQRAANTIPLVEKFDTGDTPMAAEFIQAVIAQKDANLDELKKVLGAEEFAKLNLQTAEKYDDLNKFTQAEEQRFVKLDAKTMEDIGVSLVFGALKNAEKSDGLAAIPTARKADAMVPIASPPHLDPWAEEMANKVIKQRPFSHVLGDKTRAISESICSAIELSPDNPDWEDIKKKAGEAIDGFEAWLDATFTTLQATNPTTKTDPEPLKRGLMQRIFGTGLRDPRNGNTTEKGDTDMNADETKALIREEFEGLAEKVAEKATEKTVQKLVEKADAEEKAKAESEEQKRLNAEKADRDKKIDEMFETVKKLAEKADAGSNPDPNAEPPDEVAKIKAEMAEMAKKHDAEQSELQKKLDLISRTPQRSPDGDQTSARSGKDMAEKSDEEKRLDSFNDTATGLFSGATTASVQ